MWAREPKGANGKRPPAICESTRWVEGYERVAEQAATMPDTRLVYVGDREADMGELVALGAQLGWPADVLVRSCHDRALPEEVGKLWASVLGTEPLGGVTFTLAARHGVKSRQIHQHLYAKRVQIRTGRSNKSAVAMTCVIAREVDAPAGTKPVEWRLLTNRTVETLTELVELIDWYRARWEIEMLFNILKTGCRVEALQLASMDKIETMLAFYLVIAWRIDHLMRLGRTCPELPADVCFERDEWEAAYLLKGKPVPEKVPALNEVVRLVAASGGFLMRKGDGEPGAKTLWLGLRKVRAFVQGRRYERELAAGP